MEREEQWKDIEGYEKCYQISNKGSVKSLARTSIRRGTPYNLPERILKPGINNPGYYYVSLRVNDTAKNHSIHRLVGDYFIPNPFNLPVINHIDGDKLNNNDWNLERTSHRENHCHGKTKIKSSSQYIGVHWDKNANKWRASIRINGKSKNLGSFNIELEAYQCRINFEKENNIINKYL